MTSHDQIIHWTQRWVDLISVVKGQSSCMSCSHQHFTSGTNIDLDSDQLQFAEQLFYCETEETLRTGRFCSHFWRTLTNRDLLAPWCDPEPKHHWILVSLSNSSQWRRHLLRLWSSEKQKLGVGHRWWMFTRPVAVFGSDRNRSCTQLQHVSAAEPYLNACSKFLCVVGCVCLWILNMLRKF